jgi:hypothetical protein
MVETVNVRCKLAMFSNLLVIVKSGKGHNFFFRKIHITRPFCTTLDSFILSAEMVSIANKKKLPDG